MFDGIKIVIKDSGTRNKVLKNPLLQFVTAYTATGEVPTASQKLKYRILTYQQAEYKRLKIRVYESGTIVLQGSLHYYFNAGYHNHNQYNLASVAETLSVLVNDLGIELETARLQNLEFGANLLIPYNPKLFISNLIVHKTNRFNAFDIAGSNGKQTLQKGKRYGLKIYDKGLQNGLTASNILRFEIKCVKMEMIRKEPIYLSDLLKPWVYNRCRGLLLNAFDDLLIREPVKLNCLSLKKRELYLNGINPGYWSTLTKQVRHKNKAAFLKLLETYSTNRIRENIRQILDLTLKSLIEPIPGNGYLLTDILKPVCLPFDSLGNKSIGTHSTNPVRCCKTCGRDITDQKAGSQFCSEKLYGKDAKRCRNINSNPRNNFKRKLHYVQSRGLLFDILPYLRLPSNYISL